MSLPSRPRTAAAPRPSPLRLALRLSAFAATVLVAAVAIVAAIVLLVDEQEIAKVKGWVQHSWVGTHVGAAVEVRTIETTLYRLKLTAYALPVLNGEFQNGGGAILPLGGQVLVAERTGQFYAVDLGQDPPAVRRIPLRLVLNEEALAAYAESVGATVGPGRNVGMAGLGTRVHDLLAIEGGRRLAASYTHWDPERNCARFRVATIALPPDWSAPPADGWRVAFETQPCLPFRDDKAKPFSGHQAGGRLWLSGPGTLIVTIGDYKFDGSHAADYPQDASTDYGKVFEIDLATGARRMVSLGHRNPQGLTQDRAGRLWSTEHGPQGGDELNLIEDGRNYGWPLVTLGIECPQCPWQRQGRHDGFTPPVYSWLPSIGVSNLIDVRGFAPNWDGDLLVGSLKNQSLHRLRLQGDRVQYDESIFIGDRIRDIAQRDDATILLWTDSARLVALSVDKEPSPAERLVAELAPEVAAVLADCRQCHAFDEPYGSADAVPLWGVYGRRIAAEDRPLYSDALKQASGSWNDATLDRFLADPQAMIPGTTMQYGGIHDAELRQQVIEFLKRLNEDAEPAAGLGASGGNPP
jgi:glucose/arabinose dehydrogenase